MYRITTKCDWTRGKTTRENYLVCENIGEYVEQGEKLTDYYRSEIRGGRWHGGSYDQIMRGLRNGDSQYVAESDKYLKDLEAITPMSRGWKTINDVVGGRVDIQAYLSGVPPHMRRKTRTTTAFAP